MGPLPVVKESPIADANGWVEVNKGTMQHTRFSNVFAIGDCSNVPTSKTAAAVAGQSGVLLDSLYRVIKGGKPVEQVKSYFTLMYILTAIDTSFKIQTHNYLFYYYRHELLGKSYQTILNFYIKKLPHLSNY